MRHAVIWREVVNVVVYRKHNEDNEKLNSDEKMQLDEQQNELVNETSRDEMRESLDKKRMEEMWKMDNKRPPQLDKRLEKLKRMEEEQREQIERDAREQEEDRKTRNMADRSAMP